MTFHCSICDEPSLRICVRCTKDACQNHLCEKCLKCSDCCECEVALDAARRIAPIVPAHPTPEVDAASPPEFPASAAPAPPSHFPEPG